MNHKQANVLSLVDSLSRQYGEANIFLIIRNSQKKFGYHINHTQVYLRQLINMKKVRWVNEGTVEVLK